MFKLDKAKYLALVRSQGVDAAVTALHHDKEAYEQETFEGRSGYQQQMWNDLEQFRTFSLELWDYSLSLQGK